MVNSEDIIIPGVYSEQIEFSGRVTPTDGVYREGIPVQILQDGIVLAEVYTDSQGYYSGQCDDHNEDLNNNIIAKIGDDTAQWNYVNSINLTSNSNTASAGDTIALTATVLDSNNDPASDRTVTFFKEECESFTGEGSNSTTTINVDVGESYDIDFSKITSGIFEMEFGNIGDESPNALYITYVKDGGRIIIDQFVNHVTSDTVFVGTSVTISNGQITCGDNQIEIKNGINYALLNKISADNGQTVDVYSHEIIGTATTNNSGVASVSYLVQGSESLYIKAKCGIILSEIYELNKYIMVTSNEELDNALTNISRGESIYVKNGTYTLSKTYNIPCINIIGEKENPPIIQVNNTFLITTDTELGTNIFENLQFRGNIGGLKLSSAYASAEIRNCNWKNMVNQYNFTAIYIYNHNDDKHVLIEDCEFINNYTTGYGHYCTNIHCIAPEGAKNITVQNCIFNATRNNGTRNVQMGDNYRVAVNHKAEWENSLTYAPATNCYFCNNQYLHANDTLYGFTSNNNCP